MNIQNVMNELKKVVYGKDEVLEKIMLCLLSKGHILLEDTPGVGKTTIAMAFSKVFDMDYKRMQFTSDVMPSDITGFKMYNKETNKFAYQKGPILTNMFLADEINRTSSKTQSALLEVMEEHHITIEGETIELEEPFFVIATQNPYGSAGTNLLPQSQMDRFMMAISIGYPSKQSEIEILRSRANVNPLDLIKPVATKAELLKVRDEIENIYVDDSIYEYVINLVEKTRKKDLIEVGCSPRGALAIMRLAKAKAFLTGRDYVVPNDVSDIFVEACTHRIVLKSRDMSCISQARKNLLSGILKEVPQPNIKKRK